MANLDFPASPVNGQTYNNYTYVQSKNVWQSIPGLPAGVPAGTIMGWGGSTAPEQWVICDGTAVSRSTYSALYAAIGTTYGIGDGTTTFNLPDLRGRIPVGSQTPISLGTATITNATPAVVTLSNHGLATGQLVYFTTTGALPTGITANTRYWVNVLTSSTFRLSTSLANALAGTSIATSSAGSGTHTVYSVDFELGGYNGEKTHAQTTIELASHTHIQDAHSHNPPVAISDGGSAGQYRSLFATNSPFWSAGDSNNAVSSTAATNQSSGLGLKSNVMQPYGVINYIIKYTAAYVPQESELVPRIVSLENASPRNVASAAARNALFPAPVQGNTVFRNDLGFSETYYELYSVSNIGGATTAGWYPTNPITYTLPSGAFLNPVPTSTTDVTNSSATINIPYSNLLCEIDFGAQLQINTTIAVTLTLNIDGSTADTVIGQGSAAAQMNAYSRKLYSTTLTSGSHTIKLRVVTTQASAASVLSADWKITLKAPTKPLGV